MRLVSAACALFCLLGVARSAEWPDETSRLFAGSGARCEIEIWVGAVHGQPDWEGRTLARQQRVRVINRRVRGDVDPGPEELLWTGEGAIQFMGGYPASFEPAPQLSLLETYLLVELLVPLWEPVGTITDAERIQIEGPFGRGSLLLAETGEPESLLVKELSRPLFDGSGTLIAAFAPADKDSPWKSVTLSSPTHDPLLTITRSRFRRGELDAELFAIDSGDEITLADLSKPLGQLLGSEGGDVYTETAGAQGLWDDGGQGGTTGPVYLGYQLSPAEVDRFLREGKLGRYGRER